MTKLTQATRETAEKVIELLGHGLTPFDIEKAPHRSAVYLATAADVMLNGVALNLAANGDVPTLTGAPERAGDVLLSPASISFFAIPEAGNNACR